MTLTLRTLPPTTNHLYIQGSGRRFTSPKAKAAKEAIGWEARSQYQGEPLEGPLAVRIALYWPDRRNRDVDNVKALLDALTSILWLDDGQIVDLHLTKAVDRENPRVELSCATVENSDAAS